MHTSPEEHTPEQFVFHNELMIERGKHVQNDEAGKDRRNIAVCHKARINLEGSGGSGAPEPPKTIAGRPARIPVV